MLDWDDLRFFLAIERHGSLSAAARELGVAQSTAGRRLASLEAALGVRLLNRTPEGYFLTAAGRQVREKALVLEDQARAVEHVVGGRDIRLSGVVRVTCAEAVAAYVLAPCFEALHREHTDIVVELIPSARELSLARQDADVSVRLSTPSQHETMVRRVGSLSYGLYASQDYLARSGTPNFIQDFSDQHFIGQLNDLENAPQFEWLEDISARGTVVFRTTSHEAAVSAALAGFGIACLARFRADREPGLKLLESPSQPPTAGIWLAVHKDSRDVVRIKAVMGHITQRLRAMRDELMPSGAIGSVGVSDGS